MGELVDMMSGDKKSYRGAVMLVSFSLFSNFSLLNSYILFIMQRHWKTKKDLVSKAMERLKDPQFAPELLTLSMQSNKSSALDVSKTESALQVLKGIVLNQDCANEIHESLPDSILRNQNGDLQIKGTSFEKRYCVLICYNGLFIRMDS